MKRYNHNKEAFKEINTEEEAYWLGFILADGCNTNGSQIRVDIKDEGHLEKLAKLIYVDGDKPIGIRDLGFGSVYYFSCTINSVIENLNNHGIVPRKSMITKLPKINENLYKHLIRGIFDGDGCLTYSMDKNYRRYTFSIVGNKELMMSIYEQILKNTDITLGHGKMKMIYRVYKRGNQQIMQILDWLYKDSSIYLERKHNKFIDMLNYYKLKKKGD
jgi:hypothetical protein